VPSDSWFDHTLEASNVIDIVDVSLLHFVSIGGKEICNIFATKSADYVHRSVDRLSISASGSLAFNMNSMMNITSFVISSP
jgi:hypothetical protein